MITVIAEHSVDLSLLPEVDGIVLDIGCRGFLFTDELRRLGHTVKAVDCDLIEGYYHQLAITNYDGYATIIRSDDPQAVRITPHRKLAKLPNDIRCYTLTSYSKLVKVEFWDLIKMDIEGSEYEVIMSLTEPPAKQLSIEFHLHTKIYGDAEVKQMEDKLLSLGYYPAKHDKTQAHGMGFNYWDSLFILQE